MNLFSEDRLKSVVYGGLDGILTMFSIISATLGTNWSMVVIIIIGVSNIFSDGISMALGDYFSTSTVNKFNKNEREREDWEFENCFEGEKKEMIEIY
jgi:hypothetical protein